MRWLNRVPVRVCRKCTDRYIHAFPKGEIDRGIDLAVAEPGDLCDSCGQLVLGSRTGSHRPGRRRDLRLVR